MSAHNTTQAFRFTAGARNAISTGTLSPLCTVSSSGTSVPRRNSMAAGGNTPWG